MKKRRARERMTIVCPEILTLAHDMEVLLREAPKNREAMRGFPDANSLFTEVSLRMQRLRFAQRRGIKPTIAREAAELGLFLAFYVHRMKNV